MFALASRLIETEDGDIDQITAPKNTNHCKC
jgi:hypothetical protein